MSSIRASLLKWTLKTQGPPQQPPRLHDDTLSNAKMAREQIGDVLFPTIDDCTLLFAKTASPRQTPALQHTARVSRNIRQYEPVANNSEIGRSLVQKSGVEILIMMHEVAGVEKELLLIVVTMGWRPVIGYNQNCL